MEASAEPPYQKYDNIWQCDELLATFQPVTGLSLLQTADDVESCMAKARYGALLDNTNYLTQWRRVAQLDCELAFKYSDWFYMPEKVCN